MAAMWTSRSSRIFCGKSFFWKESLGRLRSFHCRRCLLNRSKWGKDFVEEGAVQTTFRERLGLITRPLAFTVVTGSAVFTGCTILQYERLRGSYVYHTPWNRLPKALGFRDQINHWWNNLPDGSKTAAAIIFVNAVVFLMWKVPSPRMQSAMCRWFMSSPVKGSSVTLLTSCFSHMDFWHFAINMYVLWSFAPTIQGILGREQFMAFYITGGVCASFASQAFRVLTTRPLHPSLGASGALFAVLSLVCIHVPDAQLALVFFPWYTFSAANALLGVVALDLTGLLLGWRMFDHAAHLGGALFGAWYLKYGHQLTWEKRAWLVQKWHKFRGLP